MFLVSSLNDKLKRTMIEMDASKTQSCKFPYEKKPQNKAIISTYTEDRPTEFNHHQLSTMTPKEWEKTFTLHRIRQKWVGHLKVNFDLNHKKLPDVLIPETAKQSKSYVKDLIDHDVLGIKDKRWNASNNPKICNYPDVKKDLFEVTQGLNSCHVVPLKEHKIEEGVDSRNSLYVDGWKWNTSTIFEDFEKKKLLQESKIKSEENTIKHWRNTEEDRLNQYPLPVSEGRKTLEQTRYYQTYKTPPQDAKFRYTTMQKVKELTWFEREKVYKKILKENPLSVACKEKVNSLVEKQMYNTYRNKYNELTGKAKHPSSSENLQKYWKDDEIVDKMKTLSAWKDIKWFHPLRTADESEFEQEKASSVGVRNKSEDKELFRRELLKPLVLNGTSILKEEEKIKQTLIENYKEKMKKEMLRQKTKSLTGSSTEKEEKKNLRMSKYPLDKASFELQQKSLNECKDDKEDKNTDDELIVPQDTDIIPNIQTYSKKYFLEAYKKVTMDDIKQKKKKMKKDVWVEYQYMHLGTYVS